MTQKHISRSAPFPEFRITRPINIGGPYPYNFESRPGDLTLIQINYPAGTGIEPIFVKLVWEDNGYARPVDVTNEFRRAAFLSSTPQTGPIAGAGFLGIFVKSIRPGGMTTINVEIELSDGSIKEVPIIMDVRSLNAEAASEWEQAATAS